MPNDSQTAPADDRPMPGDALIEAGIKPMSPWEVLHRMQAKMTPEIAGILSRSQGTTAEFWLNLQAAYERGCREQTP